jgi:hypothetical protein
MKLFIDTNIFLDFFNYSGEDIGELHKLAALMDEGKVDLLVTDQICDEFLRNRDEKISGPVNELRKATFKLNVPAYCRSFDEFKELQEALKAASAAHAKLLARVNEEVSGHALEADKLIHELFEKAKPIKFTPEIYSAALERFRIGNPPGKKKVTVGDEVNWESIKTVCKKGEDLYVVSIDGDYRSPMNEAEPHEFLRREWKETFEADLKFHRTLSGFFKDKLPGVKLASDVKIASLVERLASSGSFATTHAVIAKLSQVSEFSIPQVEGLVEALELNSQVNWIAGDDDVSKFYKSIADKYHAKLKPEFQQVLDGYVEPA